MEYNQFRTMRDDIRNLNDAMNNDDLESVMNKNFGIFPKKSVIKMYMKRKNNL